MRVKQCCRKTDAMAFYAKTSLSLFHSLTLNPNEMKKMPQPEYVLCYWIWLPRRSWFFCVPFDNCTIFFPSTVIWRAWFQNRWFAILSAPMNTWTYWTRLDRFTHATCAIDCVWWSLKIISWMNMINSICVDLTRNTLWLNMQTELKILWKWKKTGSNIVEPNRNYYYR